jgi:osmotically-inducible protein OsmY
MPKSDKEIRKAVLRELEWDSRTNDATIDVEVANGVATLVGTVGSWAKKIAAQEAAHRVFGVLDVANDLQIVVQPSDGRTDTDIAHAVRLALQWDVFVPDDRIHSTVSRGWVTLEGEVDYLNQRDDCERIVRNLVGVRGVTNKIEIAPSKVDQLMVKSAIEAALERRAEREAHRVGVIVENGRALLDGVVGSRAERDAIVGAARGTAGVRAVEDHLRIEPFASAHG